MGKGAADTCSTLCARDCDLSLVGPSQICTASKSWVGTQSGCRQGLRASMCSVFLPPEQLLPEGTCYLKGPRPQVPYCLKETPRPLPPSRRQGAPACLLCSAHPCCRGDGEPLPPLGAGFVVGRAIAGIQVTFGT